MLMRTTSGPRAASGPSHETFDEMMGRLPAIQTQTKRFTPGNSNPILAGSSSGQVDVDANLTKDRDRFGGGKNERQKDDGDRLKNLGAQYLRPLNPVFEQSEQKTTRAKPGGAVRQPAVQPWSVSPTPNASVQPNTGQPPFYQSPPGNYPFDTANVAQAPHPLPKRSGSCLSLSPKTRRYVYTAVGVVGGTVLGVGGFLAYKYLKQDESLQESIWNPYKT